jgi:hypothetical protein
MKKTFKQLVLLTIPLMLVAVVATAAYYPPQGAPTGIGNRTKPFNVSAENQDRLGSLSVNTFRVRLDSLFNNDVYVLGQINGGYANDGSTPALLTSQVTVGNVTNPTAILVNGKIRAMTGGQSDTLKFPGSATDLKNVCATADGTYVLCN